VSLAELWDPSTAREVARASRQDVSKTSAQLQRLVGRGAVVEVARTGRTKHYQVAERMYNIYYLMRRRGAPSERVKAVVQFMVQFYEEPELVEVARRLTEEACSLSREDRQYHYHAFEGIMRATSPEVTFKILSCAPQHFLEAPDRPESLRQWLAEIERGAVCPCGPRKHPNEQVNRLLEQGNEARRDGRNTDAEREFREAIRIDASYADAWIRLGRVLAGQPGRKDEVERALSQATRVAPGHPAAWYALGDFLSAESDRASEAESAFRKALEVYPNCVDSWLALADLASKLPNREQEVTQAYREAEEACARQLEQYSGDASRWYQMARIRHDRTHRFAEAETAYRKAIEIDPKHRRAWGQLGALLHQRLERYAEAEAAYRKAIEIDPKHVSALGNLGLLLRDHLGNCQEAETHLRRIIELRANSVDKAWADLGKVHEMMGRFEEAEAAYREAIKVDPEYHWAWEQLAILLHRRVKRYEEAEVAYRRALETGPKCVCALGGFGRLLRDHLGKYQEAETHFRRIIELGADSADSAWTDLGLLYERQERYAEAEDAYREAIDTDGQNVRARTQLVRLVLAVANEPERAFDLAQLSLAAIPDRPALLNSLAWHFYELGPVRYIAEAEKWTRKAVELEEDPALRHTLTCVLARAGKAAKALTSTGKLLDDPTWVETIIDDMVTLFAELVAADCATEAYRVLRDSESATVLEPVLAALRMHLDEPVHVAVEIAEVAKDVLKRFQDVCEHRKAERSGDE